MYIHPHIHTLSCSIEPMSIALSLHLVGIVAFSCVIDWFTQHLVCSRRLHRWSRVVVVAIVYVWLLWACHLPQDTHNASNALLHVTSINYVSELTITKYFFF